jgi:hypothetical protein
MQEHIKRLAIEAGFSVEESGAINDGIETAADFSEELARFAQAVARECADICDKPKNAMRSSPSDSDLIRARFGLEG